MSINHKITSSNGDKRKVLATVAAIVYDFTEKFSNALIFIKGSTDSRTRLYQINIGEFWFDIEQTFTILGYKNDRWELFRKNRNYESFLIHRKTASFNFLM